MNESLPPGALIRAARKAHTPKLSQHGLAKLAGVSQVAIKKIESGETRKSKFLPKIARVLSIPLEKLDRSLSVDGSEEPAKVPARENKQPLATIPGGDLIGAKDLPVHASAQGGRGALVVSSEPVDWVSRPEPLSRVKDGYGIIVSENSMSPEFESGDIALVHPHIPPIKGRTCVFYSENADGTVEACIKRLRRETPDAWHVTQFNPLKGQKRDFVLKKSEWQKCHVTVGNYKRR